VLRGRETPEGLQTLFRIGYVGRWAVGLALICRFSSKLNHMVASRGGEDTYPSAWSQRDNENRR